MLSAVLHPQGFTKPLNMDGWKTEGMDWIFGDFWSLLKVFLHPFRHFFSVSSCGPGARLHPQCFRAEGVWPKNRLINQKPMA